MENSLKAIYENARFAIKTHREMKRKISQSNKKKKVDYDSKLQSNAKELNYFSPMWKLQEKLQRKKNCNWYLTHHLVGKTL